MSWGQELGSRQEEELQEYVGRQQEPLYKLGPGVP